jgi:DNA-binding PadR family transcriptional regulator
MFQISNVEFILLALIHENKKITGYRLNNFVEERGYREWADIGTTSIYNGLKKLKQKGYVTAATDRYKKGKGPKGVNYTLTSNGLSMLKQEVQQGLSATRERGGRFMLAISALPVLPPEEVIEALVQRTVYLHQEFERIHQKYEQQRAYLPLHAELLFRYSFAAIKHEISVTEEMITLITKGRRVAGSQGRRIAGSQGRRVAGLQGCK